MLMPSHDRRRRSVGLGRIWPSDRRGNVALIFTLLMPGLLLTAMGAIELNQVLSDKRRTQDVADAAALMGAGQLGVSPVGAGQRAEAYAVAQLGDVQSHAAVSTSSSVAQTQQGATMTVGVDTQRASFFGNFLPPGGFHTHVTSTALSVSSAPLCVLGIAATAADQIHITGTSQLQAGQCLVHSNTQLNADGGASIQASANEAGTTAGGPITVPASQNAPLISDPFTALSIGTPLCTTPQPPPISMSTSGPLLAGTYGPVNIQGNATVTLSGTYYFCGTLTISGTAQVTGTDTVLVFEKGANLSFGGASATLKLGGRQTGPLAGFVLIADRNYTGNFNLQSDFITGLTGTIYVPSATLAVQGTGKSGASTPWTVITAENIQVNGGAQLVINADYSASSVPVPSGVGNQRASAGAKLTQ
jgi:Flp pilus assembly protein TadG